MGPPGGAGTFVESLAALRALDPTSFVAGYIAYVAGYGAVNDGGGGLFEYDPASAAVDNDGTIVEPANGIGAWLRLFSGPINVKWFGALGDSTGQTVPLQNAMNATPAGGKLYFPSATGSYTFTTLTYANLNGRITIQGDGWQNTNSDFFGNGSWNSNVRGSVLRSTAAAGSALSLSSINGCNLRDIALIGPGSGTAIGVSVTSGAGTADGCYWENSLIANFLQGVDMNAVLDSQFNSIQVRGCSTGWRLSNASNQNVFNNLQIQTFTVFGLRVSASALNCIYGGLFQTYTGAAIVLDGGAGGRSLHVNGVYFEAQNDNTDALQILNGDYSTVTNCWFSGGATNRDRVRDTTYLTRYSGNRVGSSAGGGGVIYGPPLSAILMDDGIPMISTVLTGFTRVTQWGAVLESVVLGAAAVALVTTVSKNVTSITLTPGKWRINGVIYFEFQAATTSVYQIASLSLVTNTFNLTSGRYGTGDERDSSELAWAVICPEWITTVTVDTPVYLVANANFAASTMAAFGVIRAEKLPNSDG